MKNRIEISGLVTYGELKNALPATGAGKVPGVRQLPRNAGLLLRRKTESGIIEIYDNGFFVYEECGRQTVYGVDRCERREIYGGGKCTDGEKDPDFGPYPWEIILEAAGTVRLAHNGERREEYREEISIDAPESRNNPELSVRPEHEKREKEEELAAWRAAGIEKMKQAMEKPTARQKEIAMMYFRDGKTQAEIAAEIGRTQAYVSKTIRRYREIVRENL